MAFEYINEAFKRLSVLDEDMFKVTEDGINNMTSLLDKESDVVRVIDAEASSETDLKDSYIGKVIVNCNVCHSHIFEEKDNIVIDDNGTVNPEEPCPYCGEEEGFVIVGEIVPYKTGKVEVEIDGEPQTIDTEDTSDVEEEPIAESVSLATKRVKELGLTEDFKDVSITTDDQHMEMTSDESGKVTITTEPIKVEEIVATEDAFGPVSDETTDEILANNDVVSEQEPEAAPSENLEATEVEDTAEETTEASSEVEETEAADKEIVEESLQLHESVSSKLEETVESLLGLLSEEISINDEGGRTVISVILRGDAPGEKLHAEAKQTLQKNGFNVKWDFYHDNTLAKQHMSFFDVVPPAKNEEFKDVSFDEIDDDSINDLAESYLKRVYENVESYKTTNVSSDNRELVVEGVIKFVSGAKKSTKFVFESKDINGKGKLRFQGTNKNLTESANAFQLVGIVDNSKLFLESLKYNYSSNETPVRGLVRRK